jgi:4-hydroxy-tetrahydrodipicolinate synthase
LFRSYAEVIERVGDSRLRIYLYHIPPVAQVPISLALIERLLKAYPGTIAGVKDSSGDWANTSAMLKQFQPHGFDVFAGSEAFLLRTLRGGGLGCITAAANVNPGPIAQLARSWQQPDADGQPPSCVDVLLERHSRAVVRAPPRIVSRRVPSTTAPLAVSQRAVVAVSRSHPST